MQQNDFRSLDFSQRPRIPQRLIWIVAAVAGHWLLWKIIPTILLIWIFSPMVAALGWMASYGWKEALRAFRFWLDQVIGEGF